MKRIRFDRIGLPDQVLYLDDGPLPEPAKGQVRIRVTAANINPSDMMYIAGVYGLRPELPATPGFEATGVIEKEGPETSATIGQRVVFTTQGVWQEYCLAEARSLIPAPDHLDDPSACQAFINPFTAYGLFHQAGLKKGDSVLFTAGNSALGKMVISLGRQRGIKVYATVRNPEQVQPLIELGAAAVINTEKEPLPKALMNLTSRQGVQAVFEAVGGKIGTQALNCLAANGLMIVYGMLSLQPTPLPGGTMIFRNLRVQGFWLPVWLQSLSKAERQAIYREVLQKVDQGEIPVHTAATYPLEEFKAAIKHANQPGRNGKIVFVPKTE